MYYSCQLEIDHVTQLKKETCQSTCNGPNWSTVHNECVSTGCFHSSYKSMKIEKQYAPKNERFKCKGLPLNNGLTNK